MFKNKETLVEWLREAHAMESDLVTMLEMQSARLAGHPQLRSRISEHAHESRRHAFIVESCLACLGADRSSLKEGSGEFSGKIGTLASAMAGDAPLKIVLASYVSESFEIACYGSIREAAELCGEKEIVAIVEQILREEEEMADYLEGQIDLLTKAENLSWSMVA